MVVTLAARLLPQGTGFAVLGLALLTLLIAVWLYTQRH
jgi:hypothetical protein